MVLVNGMLGAGPNPVSNERQGTPYGAGPSWPDRRKGGSLGAEVGSQSIEGSPLCRWHGPLIEVPCGMAKDREGEDQTQKGRDQRQ